MRKDSDAYRLTHMDIVTDYDPPPIPVRFFDWTAYDARTYDGDETSIIGYGATEAEAIADLKARMEEREQ